MPSITSDQIRDISIKTVEGFLNHKVPLSEGLAKQASSLQLNSEQIQRSVEATNSIAYLKVLTLTDDRTIEFPLCKYAEVMAKVSLPESSQGYATTITKSASLGKSVPSSFTSTKLVDAEQRVLFIKQAAINDAQLQELKDRATTILPEMIKAASAVKADSQGLEKLATVTSGLEFSALTKMAFGETKVYSDSGLFKQAELKQVIRLSDLYKEARLLQSSISEKQALSDRSALLKVAFLGAMGSGIGKMIGSVVATPIKAIGKGIANTAVNLGNKAGNVVKAKIGKPLTPMRKGLGIGAVIGTGATIGFDAAMYSPGKDTSTGESKDAWSALQRS
jgi:hypothetical protein